MDGLCGPWPGTGTPASPRWGDSNSTEFLVRPEPPHLDSEMLNGKVDFDYDPCSA